MTRKRERVIIGAAALTLICCALTIWTSSKFNLMARDVYNSNQQQQELGHQHHEELGHQHHQKLGHQHRDELGQQQTLSRKSNILHVDQEAHVAKAKIVLEEKEEQPEPQYDTWDNTGAIAILRKYNVNLNKNMMPITADPFNMSTITEWWQAAAMSAWYFRAPVRYNCKQKLKFAGEWSVCQDPPYTVQAPCLVYSFGIAYDFTFDDAWGDIGCDVRSFDPSMLNISDHRRNDNVQFYRYGLYDRNTDNFQPDFDEYVKDKSKWKMRTLKHIVGELGHQGRTIDILKIDVESTEWVVLDQLMETDMLKYVRHLLVEYHLFATRPPKADYVYFFKIHTKLRKMGFREYYNRAHTEIFTENAYRHQAESFYINANFRPNID